MKDNLSSNSAGNSVLSNREKDENINPEISSVTIKDKTLNTDNSNFEKFSEKLSYNIRFIMLGLFLLIGFIVIVYAILVAVVAAEVIQAANVFFVVTIISISILVGTLAHKSRVK